MPTTPFPATLPIAAILTAASTSNTDNSRPVPDNPEETDLLTCNHCGDALEEADAIFIDNEYLCQHCADELTFICYDCGNRHWNDEAYSYNGSSICGRCYDSSYNTCEDCGRIIYHDDTYYQQDDDDYGYCYSCYNKRHRVIHGYDYKPTPLFYTTKSESPLKSNDIREGLFYGIELEIDKGGEDSCKAEELLEIGNNSNEHIYIKHDGSLNDGFEIVTHPMTLDYHINKMLWSDIFNRALEQGYRSHNTSTCGLHIHVDRNALGKNSVEQENTIARILYFIEGHWDNLLIFSRRTELQISRWANRYGLLSNPKETLESAKKSYSGRYVCLNLQNYSTIEFRIFRGTLKYSTFIATLQMVDEICKKAISMSDAKFQAMTWDSFILGISKRKKPELIQYLTEKQLFTARKNDGHSTPITTSTLLTESGEQ
ncbi:amidoligase family protein [Tyzzerella sp. OttesenSCG-928-J15]|nr:amidoligase family protein [Tyzzerella sp. OttesenSCG-928-J15]